MNNELKNTIVDIEGLIPQKKPFVMVDKLYVYNNTTIVSGLDISEQNILTKNGFFSEAGLIEHMAQTIALHRGYSDYINQKPSQTGYIGSIKKVSISRVPKIGEEVITQVEILHEIMGVTLVSAVSKVNDEVIASGEIKTAIAK